MKSFVIRPQGSIGARLFVLVLVLALPLQLLIVGAVWQMARLARDAQYGGVSYMRRRSETSVNVTVMSFACSRT
jgi:hypothetical protein